MRKAQGLSLNTIIIAAIVMTVLVVLVLVFTGRMSWFQDLFGEQTGANSCTDNSGSCVSGSCPANTRLAIGRYDCDAGERCCLPIEDDDTLTPPRTSEPPEEVEIGR